jgi:hypothetical protein
MMYLVSLKPIPEETVAWVEKNMRAAADRIERNPWTHKLRRAKAEAEATGSNASLDAFMYEVKKAREAGDPWLT